MTPLREAFIAYLPAIVVPPVLYAVVPVPQLESQAYLYGSVMEASCIGALCIVLAFINHDRKEAFGFVGRSLPMSFVFGGMLIVLQATIRYAFGSPPFGIAQLFLTQSLAQPFPSNIGSALFVG